MACATMWGMWFAQVNTSLAIAEEDWTENAVEIVFISYQEANS